MTSDFGSHNGGLIWQKFARSRNGHSADENIHFSAAYIAEVRASITYTFCIWLSMLQWIWLFDYIWFPCTELNQQKYEPNMYRVEDRCMKQACMGPRRRYRLAMSEVGKRKERFFCLKCDKLSRPSALGSIRD